jgi:hypothetical protein
MMISLQLFGALLKEATRRTNSSNNIMLQLEKLLERMLLLSAGANNTAPFSEDHQSDDNADESVFGIRTVADACLQYLLCSISSGEINAARKVYSQILFRSNYGASGQHKTVAELETMKEFVNECIQVELNNSDDDDDDKKKKKQRLGRLYNAAIQLFEESNPSLADSYRSQRRDAHVRFASN